VVGAYAGLGKRATWAFAASASADWASEQAGVAPQ
jgi:hypothetical protein